MQVSRHPRLLTAAAALAASDWPAREQSLQPYKPHRVAERAARELAAFASHPAVQQMGEAAANQELSRAFAESLAPASSLAAALVDFAAHAPLAELWAATAADWEQAARDVAEVFEGVELESFLQEVFGPLSVNKPPAFFPNLLFPGQQTVIVGGPECLFALAPPPRAWGASSPWRYNERRDQVLSETCQAFASALYAARPSTRWPHPRAAELVGRAAATNFLRDVMDEAASRSYLVMESKTGLYLQLPDVVLAVAHHLKVLRSGEPSDLVQHLAAIPV